MLWAPANISTHVADRTQGIARSNRERDSFALRTAGGEPGIGKSRILTVLRERLDAQSVQALRFTLPCQQRLLADHRQLRQGVEIRAQRDLEQFRPTAAMKSASAKRNLNVNAALRTLSEFPT